MEWQTIDSAPRFDWEAGVITPGPYVDVWAINDFGRGRRFTNVRKKVDRDGGDLGWFGLPVSPVTWTPTHWMPLPAPPEPRDAPLTGLAHQTLPNDGNGPNGRLMATTSGEEGGR